MIERLAAGFALSILISGAGWRLGALTSRGAFASVVVGTAVIGGASWIGALLLGAFFVSSSVLSRRTSPSTDGAKGSRRDARQVFANGGIAALAALSAPWLGDEAAVVLLAGALSAATADTWASEIGSRSGHAPRMLVSRRRVTVGLSGGVTVPGTLGSVGGAASIGLLAASGLACLPGGMAAIIVGLVVTMSGVFGSLLDSLLGEVAQQRRHCDVCGQWTEALVHRCGTGTVHVAGIEWIDNDLVNLACTTGGLAVAAFGLVLLL